MTDPAGTEQLRHPVVTQLRWAGLAVVVGVLAGLSSAFFLMTLQWVTRFRITHGSIVWLLPVAGLAMGATYAYIGGRAAGGTTLLLDTVHEPRAWMPRRQAPLIYATTILTHLFGGSAGREGTAIQMSGSLTDLFCRVSRRPLADRRVLLVAALSGAFGACFGVPLAGALFGLEVRRAGRLRFGAVVPAVVASFVGDRVVRALGVHHEATPALGFIHLTPGLVAKVALAGVAFGLCGIAFIELTHAIHTGFRRTVRWAPARPVLGGAAVLILMVVVASRDYLGLSLPLAHSALAGDQMGFEVFALKLVFTAVTLGSGFQGGEVTPLFVMGATLGAAAGHMLGVPVPLMAAIGYVAVFGGAAHTPLTCAVMGMELFGVGAAIPLALGCAVSFAFSSHRGLYGVIGWDPSQGRQRHRLLRLTDAVRRRATAPSGSSQHVEGEDHI